MFNLRLADDRLYAVYLAVACYVFDGSFVLSLLPRDVLDEIWDLIKSVSDDFPTYFYQRNIDKLSVLMIKLYSTTFMTVPIKMKSNRCCFGLFHVPLFRADGRPCSALMSRQS